MHALHSSDTTSANSSSFSASGPDNLPVSFVGGGLDGATFYTLQIQTASGWEDLMIDGSLQKVTDTNNVVTIYGPGTYRGVKTGATASTLGAACKGHL